MAIKIQKSIRTLRLKVKVEGYAWRQKRGMSIGGALMPGGARRELPPEPLPRNYLSAASRRSIWTSADRSWRPLTRSDVEFRGHHPS
jgi:hypothetical protein